MKLAHFQTDARPHRGYVDVYVNPDDVSSVTANAYTKDNPGVITMKNGTVHTVNEWPSAVIKKLEDAAK